MRSGRPFLCLAVVLLAGPGAAVAAPRTLSFEERVAAQRAVEEVYWRHRIWPKENPGPKPPLESVLSEETLRRRVEDTLRKSTALEVLWGQRLSGKALQAELDRIVRGTRSPLVLREIIEALGDDPQLAAETLARERLVDRLTHSFYAQDARLHAAARARAELALSHGSGIESLRSRGVDRSVSTFRRDTVPAEEWKRLEHRLGAMPLQELSSLQEDEARFFVLAVLARDASSLSVVQYSWPKTTFDAWWEIARAGFTARVPDADHRFTLQIIDAAPCVEDSWSPIAAGAPDPRTYHTAVWTGAEMVVWGGHAAGEDLNTGSRYDPATDTWRPVPVTGQTPSGRRGHAAVWTGTEMLVWGGSADAGTIGSTGALYDPETDTWRSTSLVGAPSPRWHHTMIWTGSEAIVWGGMVEDTTGQLQTGARYRPDTDSWTPTAVAGAPTARDWHTAVWTGNRMVIWGGSTSTVQNTGGMYDPSTNTWSPTSVGANVPSARYQHLAFWTGSTMIVWGGSLNNAGLNSGGRYDPLTNTWRSTSVGPNVPAPRRYARGVWTGTEMLVWGGSIPGESVATGGRYDPLTDTWAATGTGPGVPAAREQHTAVWTGEEMVVWGGDVGNCFYCGSNTGSRYSPVTDGWTPTDAGTVAARAAHASVWTGTEMIVWGGQDNAGPVATGGRYDFVTDSWQPTSLGPATPAARARPTAVWTGTEMLVWGGYDWVESLNTGGRYSPLTNGWRPISLALAPEPREYHSAVWTGTEMIVWGGRRALNDELQSGGRYNPLTDIWIPTSLGADVPGHRSSHTAVFTKGLMLVWGGSVGGFGLSTGGIYDPSKDAWHSMNSSVAVRYDHKAVATEDGMIVWGGFSPGISNTGAIYDLGSDTWLATSTASGVPNRRWNHTALWTGREMIVWGGIGYGPIENTGGRLDPNLNAWTPTSLGPNVPTPRSEHTAVWTGREMIVWGGFLTASGARYCACPLGRLVYRDDDLDGFGDPGRWTSSCDGSVPAGYALEATDCEDTAPTVHPGAPEACNAVDDDCDGIVDGGDTDADAILSACDNCSGVANSNQSDFDADGRGDACDLDDGLIYLASPPDRQTVTWEAEQGFTSWNVYRGDLQVLRATGVYTQIPGSNTLADRFCGLGTTQLSDITTPASGAVAFQLVTGVSGGVESGLGDARPNAHPCP